MTNEWQISLEVFLDIKGIATTRTTGLLREIKRGENHYTDFISSQI